MYLHVEGYDGSSMASIHFHGAILAIYYFHSCHQKYPAAARCTSIVRLSHMTDHDHEAAHAYVGEAARRGQGLW